MKERKPIIGLSGSIYIDIADSFPGYRRAYVNEDYILSVELNGGIPIILPLSLQEEIVERYIENIDGLILTGGHDVSPRFYGEDPNPKLEDIYPDRDKFDFLLIKKAKEKGIPILGICRGLQILNVYHGGSLWQDLSLSGINYLKHDQVNHSELVTHIVNIDENSKLYKIFNSKEIFVNSFHHQVIKNLGKGLKSVAHSNDGIIEAIESTEYDFMLGVQWHPEMLHKSEAKMNNIFSSLIEKAKKN